MDRIAVLRVAETILAEAPDPAVKVRLLRDVLWVPVGDKRLVASKRELEANMWVRRLGEEQRSDGGWGRFHSADARSKRCFPTTEVAVSRALALGLAPDHPLLARATRYLIAMLSGEAFFPDPPERNDRWVTGRQLFAAGTLALIDPWHPALDPAWGLWAEIARRAFASGAYDPEAEVEVHRSLTGASVRDSYLVLNNRYALALLGGRAEALPPELERAVLMWVWGRAHGLRYLAAPLSSLPSGGSASALDRWLSSLELLASFPSWRELAVGPMGWLWEQRTAEGWDLGRRPAHSRSLPLSANWRQRQARRHDWSTRVLCLLAQATSYQPVADSL